MDKEAIKFINKFNIKDINNDLNDETNEDLGIKRYRQLANLTEEDIITEDNLDKWALNKAAHDRGEMIENLRERLLSY